MSVTTRIPTTLAFLSLTLAGASARAQPATEASPFMIGDRGSDLSSAGVAFSAVSDVSEGDALFLRLEPHIEHSFGEGGLLASLPLAFALVRDADDAAAIGNLELGGFVSKKLSAKTILILRLSTTVPTADDDFEGFIVNISSGLGRINDVIALSLPDTIWARGGASVLIRNADNIIRLDGGLDIPVLGVDDNEIEDRTPYVHLGGGIAFGGGPVKTVFELTNLFSADADLGSGDDFIHQLAFSVAIPQGERGAFQLGVSTLLDSLIESDDGAIVSFHVGYSASYGYR